MKKIKNLLLISFILGVSLLIMNGCTDSNNRNWNDLTPEEQEEVRQTFNNVRKDLETMYPEGYVENKFTEFILDKLDKFEQEIEKEN